MRCRHENEEVSLILGPEIALFILILLALLEEGAPWGGKGEEPSSPLHLSKGLYEKVQVHGISLSPLVILIEKTREKLSHHICRHLLVDLFEKGREAR